MTEGGIYDRELAALAIKQASGDLVEAIFLLRAYRTTLPRLAVSEPLASETCGWSGASRRFTRTCPAGRCWGRPTTTPTGCWTSRCWRKARRRARRRPTNRCRTTAATCSICCAANSWRARNRTTAARRTTSPAIRRFTCSRSARLQQLVRGDEGFLLALGYATQRGYGRNHPFAGEIRTGHVSVEIVPEELGFAIDIGEILLTECEMVNGFVDPKDHPPHFTRGYGLVFGRAERKAMAMALVDRALQSPDYGEGVAGPAQDEEFVLAHADNVEAAGFVSHLKLPHYVDFQAELALLKRLRQEYSERQEARDE